ncbi:hypothetical protein HYALB_00011012 [Hymenoscyphus albidus]|uniref:Rhodopsin domain-containing protein n=1 Tax=Hymenoscyphus albidus TaxID=595503 RepID=A0A9N9LJD7_9HELO|nr:hypothetical protein HYALB_00011012 [Hymenoscyphus albidus]
MDHALEAAIASGKIPSRLASNITTPEYLDFLLQDDSGRLVKVVSTLAALEVLFVALFYYSRLRFKTESNLDLWLMVPAFLTTFSHLIFCFVFIKYAQLGRHIQLLTRHQTEQFLKFQMALTFLNSAAVTLPKFCILCLYHRVFKPKPYRHAIYFIAAFLTAHWLAHFILQLSVCTPFEKQWHPWVKGHCLNSFKSYIWLVLPSIAADMMIIILPLPMIWKLQTSIGQKLGLTATFLAGSIGIITAITRFAIFLGALSHDADTIDISWVGIDVILWASIEPGVYLIAACLPSLRPLLVATLRDISPGPTFHSLRQRIWGGFKGAGRNNSKHTPRDMRPERAITIRLSDNGKFNRLGEGDGSGWPSDFSGHNPAMSTCFRESTDLEEDRGRPRVKGKAKTKEKETETWGALSGIMVRKEYSIRSEAVVVDPGSEYVVSNSVAK